MEYLKSVLNSILKESAQQDSIIDAIKKKYEVSMSYEPDETGRGGGSRIVQPVAYGTSKAGNPVVRAFQPYGDTKTKVPHWKLFRLDKINGWKPLKNRKFSEPPSEQFGGPGFNSNGDGSMSEVFVSSSFDNSRYEGSGLKKYNDKRHEDAVEKNPYHDIKKNIKKSIDGMQFDYIRKNIEDWQKSSAHNEFKGNQKSVYDMERTDSFDTGNYEPTYGPVTKGNEGNEAPNSEPQKPNYNNVKKNGPVYKDTEEKYNDVETDVNTEDNENIENDEQRQV